MIKKIALQLLISLLVFSCAESPKDASVIVDKSIDVSGGKIIEKSIIDFDFRNRHYKATRKNGLFEYERQFQDSITVINDVLNNKGFKRFINNEYVELAEKREQAYSSSVNSVHYFSVLPYSLNSEAVNKSYLETVTLKNKEYHKIKVTFNEDGGGEDFEDVFIYWINTENYKVDYLAYSYSENHGMGLRFREAYNERYVEGIRFVDYNNYKPKNGDATLENLDVLFEKEELELLSKIKLENIKVRTKAI